MRSVTIYDLGPNKGHKAIDNATGLEIEGIASMEKWYEPTEIGLDPFRPSGKQSFAFNFQDGRREEVDAKYILQR